MAVRPPKPPDVEAAPRYKSRGGSGSTSMTVPPEGISLDSLGKEYPSLAEYLDDKLHGQSQFDRATAITATAYVEDALERALLARLVPLSNPERESLFKYEKPFGNFGARIRVGHAINLFGPITRDELNLIRKMRNVFAHGRRFLTFTQPTIAANCRKLKLPGLFEIRGLSSMAYPKWPPPDPRGMYTGSCQILIEELNGEYNRTDAALPSPLHLP